MTVENSTWNPVEDHKAGRFLPGFPAGTQVWLPANGLRYYNHGMLQVVNSVGTQWPSTRIDNTVYNFYFDKSNINLLTPNYFPNGYPVRCVRL